MKMVERRSFIAAVSAFAGFSFFGGCECAGKRSTSPMRRFALNPPTVRGYGLSFRQQVELAIEAGFDGLEPWVKDAHAAKARGELADAIKLARDANLKFVNGIAFGAWVDSDAKKRAAGLEETKRDMALLSEIGCECIAASMFGSHKKGAPILSPDAIAERYAALCDLGRAMGVRPLLEYWGHSVNLHTPEEAIAVAAKADRANAGILPDVYHTYRGGGSFDAFRFFSAATVPVLHMNDYPQVANPATLTDADRVWPGDGAAPWRKIFAALDEADVNPYLSIELFNPNYWKTTPIDTLKTALAKMKKVVEG